MIAPVLAADIPARRPVMKAPVAAPAYSWSGCYIGAHVGGGWGDKDWFDTGIRFATHDIDGWLAGGQIGCDVQTGAWVFGIEGQAAWADISGGAPNIFSAAFQSHSSIDFIASVTGRIGYAWDRVLLYAKGGVAWVHDKHWQTADSLGGGVLSSGSKSRDGWTVGGGLEWAFAPNWSTKVEYNFMDLGIKTVSFTGLDDFEADIKQRIHTVKVGLNYRANWGSSVIPRH